MRIRTRDELEYSQKSEFKIPELAPLLGVTGQSIHNWIHAGRIRGARQTTGRGTYLVPRREAIRLLREAGREVPGLWEHPRVRVLLIDDDSGVRAMARTAAGARAFPMTLEAAATLEDGLLVAGGLLPEVILLGCSFPDSSLSPLAGLAFIRKAQAIRKARVVAMVDTPALGEKMLEAGADAILEKPFGLPEFRTIIYLQWKALRRAGKAPEPSGTPERPLRPGDGA